MLGDGTQQLIPFDFESNFPDLKFESDRSIGLQKKIYPENCLESSAVSALVPNFKELNFGIQKKLHVNTKIDFSEFDFSLGSSPQSKQKPRKQPKVADTKKPVREGGIKFQNVGILIGVNTISSSYELPETEQEYAAQYQSRVENSTRIKNCLEAEWLKSKDWKQGDKERIGERLGLSVK